MLKPKLIAFLLILAGSVCLVNCSTPGKGEKEKDIESTSEIASTQKANFTLVGRIHAGGDTLTNSILEIYEGAALVEEKKVTNNQRFQVDFQFNKEYTIVFSKPGFSTKQIAVNTHIPDDINGVFPPFKIEVNLDQVQTDASIGQPKSAGKIFYNAEIDNFDSEVFLDHWLQ